MKKNGFKRHLVLSTAFVVCLVCVLNFVLYTIAYDRHSASIFKQISSNFHSSIASKQEEQADTLADILSHQLFNPVYHSNLSETYHLIETNLSQPFIEMINVVDGEGFIFHDGTFDIARFGELHPNQDIIKQVISSQETTKIHSGTQLIIVTPISESNIQLGVLYIELNSNHLINAITASDTSLEVLGKTNKQNMFRWQIVFTCLSLMIGIAMAYRIGSSFSTPINSIIKQLRHYKSSRITPIKSTGKYNEFNHLVNAFNNMQNSVSKHTRDIEHMAYHDRLTDLPNRNRFIQLLNDSIAVNTTESLAVLFIDLNNFKDVNDHYGRCIGDEVLIAVSQVICNSIESYQVEQQHQGSPYLASRIGVDEFIVAMPCKTATAIQSVADMLFLELSQPIEFERFKLTISASIGIVTYPEFGSDAELLCRQAELAMVEQKRKGKNTHTLYTHEMNSIAEERLYIEKELRSAMNDLAQFELWYQPKFAISTGAIVGAEALVRWKHPQRGYIWPDQFIPIAESSDIILTLGEYLISLATKQAAEWRPLFGDNFYIALNLSSRQLHRQNVVEIISQALIEEDLPASALHVEVTETLLMSDSERIQKILAQLSEMGVQVWLDDFGTGYSSLSYLQKYKFDGVKIDRSFISNLASEDDNSSLIEAILAMSSSLKMMNVAEGIETEYQLERLKELGCEYGQGYLISRPLPAADFVQFNHQYQSN